MDSIGDRMKKNYENRYRGFLTRRTPAILRLDGKAFHTLTRSCDKPFDKKFIQTMLSATTKLSGEIQGFKLAYVQSDEVSFLITDYDTINTEAWFDYNINKMVSVSASIMSVAFSLEFGRPAVFDSRVFNIPEAEIANYFLWRARDWHRNSILMYAQSVFSHKQMQEKNLDDLHEMLHEKGLNWTEDLTGIEKNGTFIYRDAQNTGVLPTYENVAEIVDSLISPLGKE